MTAQKHLKQLVRARMKKTGESYATARRQTIRQAACPARQGAARWHLPGNIPGTTALRILLTDAGIVDPHTKKPFSEAMLFGIAGGIGIGVFSFLYEKEDFASFYVAGRHSWQDEIIYLRNACQRLGIEAVVQESAGAKAAEKQLRDVLAEERPVVAWVDMAHLPYRGLPAYFSGGGYHVVSIYSIDDDRKTALIGDLTDDPIEISLTDLATSRARIKKQKHRLLSISAATCTVPLHELVQGGLRACHEALAKGKMQNFRLDAIKKWGERMHDSKDPESWERIFTRGHRLMTGLKSIHEYIEYYGTGGGLCRPIFAEFLNEVAVALKDPNYRQLADRYAELGRSWSELAEAALPDEVPLFRELKALSLEKSELLASEGADAGDKIRIIWKRTGELGREAKSNFPLSEAACADLRAALQKRILALHDQELEAHAAMGKLLS